MEVTCLRSPGRRAQGGAKKRGKLHSAMTQPVTKRGWRKTVAKEECLWNLPGKFPIAGAPHHTDGPWKEQGHLAQKPWASCWSSRDGSSNSPFSYLCPLQYNNKAAWWSRAGFLCTLDRMQFILLFCSLWSQNLDPEWLDEIRGQLWESGFFLPVSGETKDVFHNVTAYWLVPGCHYAKMC